MNLEDARGIPSAGAGSGEDFWQRIPWPIWIVVVWLGLEGLLSNLPAISVTLAAACWFAGKCLMIVGLLRRWRSVFVVFLLLSALHVVAFSQSAPIVAVLNLVLMLLTLSARRFYFPRGFDHFRFSLAGLMVCVAGCCLLMVLTVWLGTAGFFLPIYAAIGALAVTVRLGKSSLFGIGIYRAAPGEVLVLAMLCAALHLQTLPVFQANSYRYKHLPPPVTSVNSPPIPSNPNNTVSPWQSGRPGRDPRY